MKRLSGDRARRGSHLLEYTAAVGILATGFLFMGKYIESSVYSGLRMLTKVAVDESSEAPISMGTDTTWQDSDTRVSEKPDQVTTVITAEGGGGRSGAYSLAMTPGEILPGSQIMAGSYPYSKYPTSAYLTTMDYSKYLQDASQ